MALVFVEIIFFSKLSHFFQQTWLSLVQIRKRMNNQLSIGLDMSIIVTNYRFVFSLSNSYDFIISFPRSRSSYI